MEHPLTQETMSNLAGLYSAFQNRYEEAEQLHAEVLAVQRRVLGGKGFFSLRNDIVRTT